jgi:hypothetical protein
MRHVCHADGCEVEVPPIMLMCKRHWAMVPVQIRTEIWRTYIPGQESRKDPSEEYLNAYHEAVEAVALKEGRR